MRFTLLLAAFLLVSCDNQPPADQPEPGKTTDTQAANADERAAIAAGSDLPQPVVATELLSCEPMAGMTPHCGYKNPEDLVLIPGTDLLIVSEMGEFMADSPGDLSLLNTTTGSRQTLNITWSSTEEPWGDADCPAPDAAALSPHGIDLVTRDDGHVSLLVVNHGKRESIEFFAVAANGDLTWRGCALPPEDPFINDVAARRDGGFYASQMWNKSGSFEDTVAKLLGGELTGWVWAWSSDDGFSRLPGSDGQMPNGIALSPDDATLYVNLYFGNRTFAIDLDTQTRVGEFELRQPDNLSVEADGTLWVASHQNDAIGQACTLVTEGPCLLPFQIIRADPGSLEPEVIIDHDGPPMGYATVALRVGNRLYLGTAHGDRIVSVELDEGA